MAPPSSVSSSDSAKRQRALESRDVNRAIANGSSKGDTLSVFLQGANSQEHENIVVPGGSHKRHGDASGSRGRHAEAGGSRGRPNSASRSSPTSRHGKRRSRSRSSSCSLYSRSRSPSPKRLRDDNEDGSPANVCMLSRSRVREIRRWMQYGIDSKSEGITLRSSYKPTFEGKYELMAPSLDPSMARKWLRNVGEYSDRAKLKDYWEKQLLSVQRKVKDVMEPLLFLLGSMPANCDADLPVGTATHLLGYVFSHISKLRRSNAMRHIAPKFSGMLIDPLLFSSREHRYLFGERFITALDKEADADARMDKIGRAGGPQSSRRSSN